MTSDQLPELWQRKCDVELAPPRWALAYLIASYAEKDDERKAKAEAKLTRRQRELAQVYHWTKPN